MTGNFRASETRLTDRILLSYSLTQGYRVCIDLGFYDEPLDDESDSSFSVLTNIFLNHSCNTDASKNILLTLVDSSIKDTYFLALSCRLLCETLKDEPNIKDKHMSDD